MLNWLTPRTVDAIHTDILRISGGRTGVRDPLALSAAVARPEFKSVYAMPDLIELASAYLFGIIRNRPFVDGNKRSGLICTLTFLWLNGVICEAEPAMLVILALGVAAGEIDEDGATRFLRDFTVPLADN